MADIFFEEDAKATFVVTGPNNLGRKVYVGLPQYAAGNPAYTNNSPRYRARDQAPPAGAATSGHYQRDLGRRPENGYGPVGQKYVVGGTSHDGFRTRKTTRSNSEKQHQERKHSAAN